MGRAAQCPGQTWLVVLVGGPRPRWIWLSPRVCLAARGYAGQAAPAEIVQRYAMAHVFSCSQSIPLSYICRRLLTDRGHSRVIIPQPDDWGLFTWF